MNPFQFIYILSYYLLVSRTTKIVRHYLTNTDNMVPTQTGPDFIHSDEFEELKANDKFLLLRNYFS